MRRRFSAASIAAALLAAAALIAAAMMAGCSPEPARQTVRYRQFPKWEPTHYHRAIQMRIGWYPYSEADIVSDEEGNVVMMRTDSVGEMPAIIITEPDSADSIIIGMRIDNELLGRLIKHSLMTQVPIKRPFEQYLVEADCSKCHPSRIKID